MSHGINIDLPAANVVALCAKHKTAVSGMQVLPHGATRVVLVTDDGAAVIRRACRGRLLPDRADMFPVRDPRRS